MPTDSQRKYLTELIGECFHEGEWCQCKHCGKLMSNAPFNRTFTNPSDFFAVVRAIDRVMLEQVLKGIAFNLQYRYDSLLLYIAEAMQKPTFIEDFMREVCRMGGVDL